MGGPGSGRPGGNPVLKEHKMLSSKPESLTAKLTVRIPQSMMNLLKELDNYPDFVREAIQEKLDRLQKD